MKLTHLAAALVALATLAGPAPAQDVVGTTVLGGKRVDLLSDRTWRFSEDGNTEGPCVPINTMLSFCGTILDWTPIPTTGTEFLRIFRRDTRTYAGVIYEDVGSDDGMTMEFMRNVVIEIAAGASGVSPADIPILDVKDTTVAGIPAEQLTYAATINGLNVVYINSIINGPAHTIQFVSWSIGTDVSDAHQAAHRKFAEAFQIASPEAFE